MKYVSEKVFENRCEAYKGFCTTCEKFTRGETEPDAENYPCPRCKKDTVMGTEQALLCGHLSIK